MAFQAKAVADAAAVRIPERLPPPKERTGFSGRLLRALDLAGTESSLNASEDH